MLPKNHWVPVSVFLSLVIPTLVWADTTPPNPEQSTELYKLRSGAVLQDSLSTTSVKHQSTVLDLDNLLGKENEGYSDNKKVGLLTMAIGVGVVTYSLLNPLGDNTYPLGSNNFSPGGYNGANRILIGGGLLFFVIGASLLSGIVQMTR